MPKINLTLSRLLVFVLILLLLTNNSVGFDLYHHVLSIYSLNSINDLNIHYTINDFKIPRYILFHYITYLWNYFGLGLIFFNVFIYTILTVDLLRNLKGQSQLVKIIFPFFILLTLLFWSPTSTIVLALISYSLTENKLIRNLDRLIITCFHPIGLIISIVLFLFKDRTFFYYLAFTFGIIWLLQGNIYSANCRITSDIDILISSGFLIDKIIESKLIEGVFMIIMLIVFYLSNKINIKLFRLKIKGFKVYNFFLLLLFGSALFITTISLLTERRTIYAINTMSEKEKKLIKMAFFKENIGSDTICYYSNYVR